MKYVESEINSDEVFVGNIETGRDLSYLSGVSYRVGNQALDIHGGKLDQDYMRPLFVAKKSFDRYNAIMQARTL